MKPQINGKFNEFPKNGDKHGKGNGQENCGSFRHRPGNALFSAQQIRHGIADHGSQNAPDKMKGRIPERKPKIKPGYLAAQIRGGGKASGYAIEQGRNGCAENEAQQRREVVQRNTQDTEADMAPSPDNKAPDKKHKTNTPVVVHKAKPLPPHVIAMTALDNLAEKKLWQNGRDKEFHTELTDILRQYIEARFGVAAMEKTSDEILDELYELAESQKASLANLKQILSIADLVKFAKYHPYADENQLSFVNSRMFVEQTKKVEVEEPGKEKPEEESAEEEQNKSTMAE